MIFKQLIIVISYYENLFHACLKKFISNVWILH